MRWSDQYIARNEKLKTRSAWQCKIVSCRQIFLASGEFGSDFSDLSECSDSDDAVDEDVFSERNSTDNEEEMGKSSKAKCLQQKSSRNKLGLISNVNFIIML